jgi:RluA family pseudouridine synthase
MILTGRVTTDQDGLRLDDGVHLLFPQLSKSESRRIIDRGGCAVNLTMVRVASRILRTGDEVIVGVMEPGRFQELAYRREDLIFEDGEYLAVNKTAGFNSQRTPYQLKGTVEYAVGIYLKESGCPEPARVVHRLDRGTSGVMFFPKTKKAATHISFQLKHGGVEKVYWAVVGDVPDKESFEVDAPVTKLSKFRYGVGLPGKPARTLFRVLASGHRATLLECRPLTGRTHQIRVHLSHLNLPILGDNPYCGMPAERMMLHCRSMTFPAWDRRIVSASATVDAAFLKVCADHGILQPKEMQ